MKPVHLRLLALALIVGGGVLLGFYHRKTVTLSIDGKEDSLSTFAFTVRHLLQATKIPVGVADRIWPVPDHWLKDGETIRIQRASPIHILADGLTYRIISPERVSANILAWANVPLYPGDQVLADGRPVAPGVPLPVAPRSLQVQRAVQVVLQEGAHSRSFYSAAATLGQALAEAGISLYAADRLDPALETPLEGTIQATLQRSQSLNVSIQGQSIQFRSAAGTVGEALAEAGLSLQGLDYSRPSASDPLPQDGQIRLVRVQENVTVEQEPLPFETEMQAASDVELDQRKVVQAGEFGMTARRVRIRYEDGKEVSRLVEDEWRALEPKPRIMGYGTKIVVRTLDTPDGPIEYWRAVDMYATSYSPCRIYKDRCDSYTALGATLQKGIVAMTNDWCRYTCGDKVYVPGYGVGTVADTGGGVPGRYWIDLGYSESDYVSWHQMVTVYFLTPVPSNFQWVLP